MHGSVYGEVVKGSIGEEKELGLWGDEACGANAMLYVYNRTLK